MPQIFRIAGYLIYFWSNEKGNKLEVKEGKRNECLFCLLNCCELDSNNWYQKWENADGGWG